MHITFTKRVFFCSSAVLAMVATQAALAQEHVEAHDSEYITVYGALPPADLSELAAGPEIEGVITARNESLVQITGEDSINTNVVVSEATEIRGRGGFLGLGRTQLASEALLNGLPVTVDTVQWGDELVASRIRLRNRDLETATMIHNATAQRFAEHGTAINQNAAATEALRGRMGDIDQYNVKGTTNVYFDTDKWNLSAQAERELCATVREAEAMDNALLLVVGYTDSMGDHDYNQQLSERRAGRVVNYLQQQCRWAPYRMLTPTGMAEADPQADNGSPSGRAQNRRVAVNILVSKAVDGLASEPAPAIVRR